MFRKNRKPICGARDRSRLRRRHNKPCEAVSPYSLIASSLRTCGSQNLPLSAAFLAIGARPRNKGLLYSSGVR